MLYGADCLQLCPSPVPLYNGTILAVRLPATALSRAPCSHVALTMTLAAMVMAVELQRQSVVLETFLSSPRLPTVLYELDL